MRAEHFTNMLKGVQDPETIQSLVKYAGRNGFWIRNRRTRKQPFHFSYYRYWIGNPSNIKTDERYCHYLYNDGYSDGKCRWENLHRTFEFY